MSNWKKFADRYELYFSGKSITSDRWCLGGTSGSCWDDQKRPVSASAERDFVELDEVLEKILPGLTFMQYKKIYRECVTRHEYNEGDYYGGSIGYAEWHCNVEDLFNYLVELGLINESHYA